MAMGITQALKLQEGPISTLAQLPQQQLMAMAQQGRIAADILPIILNEKAQMAQQAANMQAAQQPMPPSVIEQAIAINAQAEAPQPQPQMMAMAPQQETPPMDTGVASLPVPEEMYSNEYAGGGIVAFQAGGDLNDEESLRALERDRSKNLYSTEEAPSFASMFSNAVQQDIDSQTPGFGSGLGLGTTMPAQRIPFKARTVEDIFTSGNVLRQREAPASPEREVIKQYLANQARKNTDVRTDAWTRALEAGLGILGGESPYALTNIGKGSQAAVKGFAEDVKERRKQTMADMQLKLQLEEAARKEKLDAISSAERIAMSEREQEAREKQGELDRTSREKIANSLPEAIRGARAIQLPNESLDAALNRYSRIVEKEPDRFNSISNRVGKANELWVQSDEYRKYNRAIQDAKNEESKAKAVKALDDARSKFYEDANITKGDLAYLRSVNAAYGATANAKPLPSKESELQKGVVYNTQRGPATWDGKQFIPVK